MQLVTKKTIQVLKTLTDEERLSILASNHIFILYGRDATSYLME